MIDCNEYSKSCLTCEVKEECDSYKNYQKARTDTISEISREMRMLYGNEYEKKIRADVIEEVKEIIDEIHKCQSFCMAYMCEHDSPTVNMCIDCFHKTIINRLDELQEKV